MVTLNSLVIARYLKGCGVDYLILLIIKRTEDTYFLIIYIDIIPLPRTT
jgi:hypothetical protein